MKNFWNWICKSIKDIFTEVSVVKVVGEYENDILVENVHGAIGIIDDYNQNLKFIPGQELEVVPNGKSFWYGMNYSKNGDRSVKLICQGKENWLGLYICGSLGSYVYIYNVPNGFKPGDELRASLGSYDQIPVYRIAG